MWGVWGEYVNPWKVKDCCCVYIRAGWLGDTSWVQWAIGIWRQLAWGEYVPELASLYKQTAREPWLDWGGVTMETPQQAVSVPSHFGEHHFSIFYRPVLLLDAFSSSSACTGVCFVRCVESRKSIYDYIKNICYNSIQRHIFHCTIFTQKHIH